MPRKPRIHFPGAIYHVITRGNNRHTIFADRKDKLFYLDKLKELSRELLFDLLIYAIMNNHAHFTIQVGNTPLSKIMHHLQQGYATYYNREHEQSGHVFQNRYRAFLCEDERYLLALLRYIHLNPVKAKITRDLDYPWSSHAYYAGKKKDNLVNTSLIHGMFRQGASISPAEGYLRFMRRDENPPQPGYLSTLQEKPADVALLLNDKVLKNIDEIAAPFGITREILFSPSRSAETAAARKETILALYHNHNWQIRDIALLLKVSRSYVRKILAGRIRLK